MDTLTVALAATCPVLLGSSSFSAFGFTNVDVTKKKIRRRNTMSVMEDIEKDGSIFVLLFMAMALSSYLSAGSCRRSIKSIVVLSMRKTRLDMLEVR